MSGKDCKARRHQQLIVSHPNTSQYMHACRRQGMQHSTLNVKHFSALLCTTHGDAQLQNVGSRMLMARAYARIEHCMVLLPMLIAFAISW